ncbi:MAG TPA: acyltransferase [Terracidiphilus sp.]
MPASRIPTLDGWRGVAILLVIVAHFQAGYFRQHAFHDWGWLDIGGHGVAIFFVLSGFLITSRLFGDGDLKRFYVRRFFRLMPVAWVYLSCVGVLGLILGANIIGRIDVVPCLLFFRNYYPSHEAPQWALTSHFWSLSVEEQFYLAWPAILMLAGRRAPRLLILGLLSCCALSFTSVGQYSWPYAGLLIGCLLAFAAKHAPFRLWAQKRWIAPVCLLGLVWHIATHKQVIPLSELALIGMLLASTTSSPASLFGRALEGQFLRSVGIYSYSLYIWQELFLLLHTGVIGLLLLPLAAVASYHLIEQPCIKFWRRQEGRGAPVQDVGEIHQIVGI